MFWGFLPIIPLKWSVDQATRWCCGLAFLCAFDLLDTWCRLFRCMRCRFPLWLRWFSVLSAVGVSWFLPGVVCVSFLYVRWYCPCCTCSCPLLLLFLAFLIPLLFSFRWIDHCVVSRRKKHFLFLNELLTNLLPLL